MISEYEAIYNRLLAHHGRQGWWPVSELNTQKYGTYHPGDYSYPRNDDQRFEIAVGAILTQNTAWTNVEKAIINLIQAGLMQPEFVSEQNLDVIKQAIRPAGYFNQKAKKLIIFAQFFSGLKGRIPQRKELLDLWGIGPETADSILLYAYCIPSFVIDAYTKRIFVSLGLISERAKYEEIRNIFETNLPSSVELYQEYHALIVAHAKQYYSKKSSSEKGPLLS